jgi:hypothetical protein
VVGAKGVSQILDVEVDKGRQACETGQATLTLTHINSYNQLGSKGRELGGGRELVSALV